MTRVIHITDLHFWRIVRNPLLLCNKRMLGNLNLLLRRRKYVRQERVAAFIEQFSTLNADVLLIGGDLTTTATDAEYKMAAAFVDALARYDVPIYITAGNHDLYTFESLRRKRFESYFGDRIETPGAPRMTLLPGGAPLLIVPTARPNFLSSRGGITKTQLTATRRLLEQVPDGPLIVLAHYPILPCTDAYRSGLMRRLGNADALRRLLGETGRPILYLAGHVHVYSHIRDPLFPKIEQVTSAALFYEKERHPGGFTEIVCDGPEHTVCPWEYCDGWRHS